MFLTMVLDSGLSQSPNADEAIKRIVKLSTEPRYPAPDRNLLTTDLSEATHKILNEEESNYDPYTALALFRCELRHLGRWQVGVEGILRVAEHFNLVGELGLVHDLYREAAQVYFCKGQVQESLSLYRQVVSHADQMRDSLLMVSVLGNIMEIQTACNLPIEEMAPILKTTDQWTPQVVGESSEKLLLTLLELSEKGFSHVDIANQLQFEPSEHTVEVVFLRELLLLKSRVKSNDRHAQESVRHFIETDLQRLESSPSLSDRLLKLKTRSYLAIAQMLTSVGALQEALKTLDQFETCNSCIPSTLDNLNYYTLRSVILGEMGEFEQALLELKKASSIREDYFELSFKDYKDSFRLIENIDQQSVKVNALEDKVLKEKSMTLINWILIAALGLLFLALALGTILIRRFIVKTRAETKRTLNINIELKTGEESLRIKRKRLLESQERNIRIRQSAHLYRQNYREQLDKYENLIFRIEHHLTVTQEKRREVTYHDAERVLGWISQSDLVERDWHGFEKQYSRLKPGSIERLKKQCPELSANDIRHCILILSGMNVSKIARVFFMNPRSIDTIRYRIKKKLGYEGGARLSTYLRDF